MFSMNLPDDHAVSDIFTLITKSLEKPYSFTKTPQSMPSRLILYSQGTVSELQGSDSQKEYFFSCFGIGVFKNLVLAIWLAVPNLILWNTNLRRWHDHS